MMQKKWICAWGIIATMLLTACGSTVENESERSAVGVGTTVEAGAVAETEDFGEVEVVAEVGTTEEADVTVSAEADFSLEDNDALRNDYAYIAMENPSWKYYIAEGTESDTKPFRLSVMEKNTNEITDREEWFRRNGLEVSTEATDGTYSCDICDDRTRVIICKDGMPVAELDFSAYVYSDDLKPEDKDFVDERISYAIVEDGILYLSIFHYTYAESAPSNAYIVAISLEDYHVLWKTAPLTCNSLNFEIIGDVIFCGYGFTAEPDNLYQVDKKAGKVLASETLKSMAEYIIYKDDKLYVRTYNTDYVFEVIAR